MLDVSLSSRDITPPLSLVSVLNKLHFKNCDTYKNAVCLDVRRVLYKQGPSFTAAPFPPPPAFRSILKKKSLATIGKMKIRKLRDDMFHSTA